MRNWGIAVLLLAGACQQQKQAQQPRPKRRKRRSTEPQVTAAAAKIAHGERLSWTLGCRGCHREKLEGGNFYERYASNLTRELPKY